LFLYEVFVSLQAKLLLLSEPDATALVAVGIASGVWEFSLRMFQLGLLRRAISRACELVSRAEGDCTDDSDCQQLAIAAALLEVKHVQTRARIYLQNLCGDMIVEYLMTNVAMLLMIYFGGSAVFDFKFSGTSAAAVSIALLAQHVPELVFDLCAIYFESMCGLDVVAYLRAQTQWHAPTVKCNWVFGSIVWALLARLLSTS